LKQHLELQAELERSITPEEGARRTGAQIATAGMAPTASGSAMTSAQTGNAPATHTITSAEYIISEIKQHKRSAALLLALVVIAVVAAGFAYLRYFGTRSQAISSIAVLPFVNASGDPNTEYVSDGISESLIDRLSQLPGLKVIARSSAFKYKGKEVDLQEVSNALGVEAILSGRVVQRGDQLQVRAELINARDKTQLWGEQYNRQVTDLQAVQEEIARTISDKLRLRLTGTEEQQLSKRATQNPEAYQLYLNGMFYARKGGFENARKAIEYQNQAVALDPSFAPAWAEMANSYSYLVGNSVLDPKEGNPKAKAAVQKALELDETLAEGHVVLARIKNDEWDWTGAQREIKRAIELNPNLARAHSSYSDYLSKMGRQTEALAETKRAQELDPLRISFKSAEGSILFYEKRYDEAIQQLQNVIKLDPDNSYSHSYLAFSFDALQRYGEAVVEFQKVKSIDGETTSNLCYLGNTLARSGKRSEAQAILEKLKSTREYVSPAELAILYAGLGDKEGAIASLEKAYNAHDLQMQFLKIEQGYDSLRTDPRFIELMRKVGLPQ
jgi:TolB-like protein/Flp pilus assembly protein TadD